MHSRLLFDHKLSMRLLWSVCTWRHRRHVGVASTKELVSYGKPAWSPRHCHWNPLGLVAYALYGTLSPKRTKIKLRWYREELPALFVTTTDAKLDELGWRSLKQRRADQRLIMLYKIVKNLVEIDLSKELIPLTPNPSEFPRKRKPIFNTAFYLEL